MSSVSPPTCTGATSAAASGFGSDRTGIVGINTGLISNGVAPFAASSTGNRPRGLEYGIEDYETAPPRQ
jgi:hypothetical protein